MRNPEDDYIDSFMGESPSMGLRHPQGIAPGAASTSSLQLPQAFVQDPIAYLLGLASRPGKGTSTTSPSSLTASTATSQQGTASSTSSTSQNNLGKLAGPIAAWFASQPKSVVAPVADAYLRAASVQLLEIPRQVGDVVQEMLRTQQQYEILETVGLCATYCKSRRMAISSSGILPTLAQMMISQPNQLQLASVEFLQCALLAEQYRYAERLIKGSWPRPNATVNVQQVLRYYYLRGMIHLGCNDYIMAHRCFWTCLSIPAEICSKIVVEAWKKLVLVQCIMKKPTAAAGTNSTINLPKSMPNCMGRMLASYKEASNFPSKLTTSSSGKTKSKSSSTKSSSAGSTSKKSKELLEPITCYMDIADAFYKSDKTKLESLLQQHQKILENDGNWGLAQSCHVQLIKNQVHHISCMYSVVSLQKIAQMLNISDNTQDIRQVVGTLLCQAQVPCDLQDDGMVVFDDTGNMESSTSAAAATNSTSSLVDLSEWMNLLDQVQRLDMAISSNPKYHALMRKENSEGRQSSLGSGPRGVEDF